MPRSRRWFSVAPRRTCLKKKVGDKIQIETDELSVVGIVDGNAWVENGSIILALPVFQEITGNPDKINIIDIRVTPSTSAKEVTVSARKSTSWSRKVAPWWRASILRNSEAYRMVQAMSWGTSLLAVLVGVLGVMNTMLMTVFERTQEICVLLALGWQRGRIIRMVLWESALLGLLGGVAGVLIGAVGVTALGNDACHPRTPGAGPEFEPSGDFCGHRRRGRYRQWPLSCVAQLPAGAQPSLARLNFKRHIHESATWNFCGLPPPLASALSSLPPGRRH